MNNAIATFYDAIAAADTAVQANSRAIRAWSKSDRCTPMPRMAEGEDTAVLGRVSCVLSPAPQSSRTNASRKNWKLDGKRVSQAVAMEALHAMVAEAPAQAIAEAATKVETLTAAGGKVQVGILVDQEVVSEALAARGSVTCTFSKLTMLELMHFVPNLADYVDNGRLVMEGSSPYQAGMRWGHEVAELIFQVAYAWGIMRRLNTERVAMTLTSTWATVLLGRMRMALDLAADKAQDERDVRARRTCLALRKDMEKMRDSFAKSVDGAK